MFNTRTLIEESERRSNDRLIGMIKEMNGEIIKLSQRIITLEFETAPMRYKDQFDLIKHGPKRKESENETTKL